MADAPTPWSQLLGRVRTEPGRAALDVTADWMQFRTVFGGLQAAVVLRAMRTLVPDVPLRTLQGTFLAPVPEGTLTATAQVLRTGKSATHVEARIVDGAQTLALLVGVFGAPRASAVRLQPSRMAAPNGTPIAFPYLPGVTPAFTQHFKVRWLRGRPPYTGDDQTDNVIEVGLRDAGPATEGHVLALADFIPPIALSHLKTPAFGSTLTWMIEFLAERFEGLALDGWRVEARLDHAREGYLGQALVLWGPGGEPVAMSRQSMVIFG